MTPTDLLARVEAAQGADEDLDWAITQWADPDAVRYSSAHQHYTSSIDDAIGLVERKLTGVRHRIQIFGREEGWGCRLTYWPGMMTVSSYEHYEDEANPLRYQATAPLAILSALLRALTNGAKQ